MKKDAKLGLKVHEHLVSLGIETPMKTGFVLGQELSDDRIHVISKHIKGCMEALNLDLTDDSLMDTPNRVAKMWVNELFSGLDYANFPKITVIDNKMGCDEMVLVTNITAHSNCEHHLVVIDQKVHIAYIPNNKIIGLSKMARISKFFSQRPQVQERTTSQIFETLKYLLETDNIAVSITGKHYCMLARGVEDSTSATVTNKFGGEFKTNHSTRAEFLNTLRNQ